MVKQIRNVDFIEKSCEGTGNKIFNFSSLKRVKIKGAKYNLRNIIK